MLISREEAFLKTKVLTIHMQCSFDKTGSRPRYSQVFHPLWTVIADLRTQLPRTQPKPKAAPSTAAVVIERADSTTTTVATTIITTIESSPDRSIAPNWRLRRRRPPRPSNSSSSSNPRTHLMPTNCFSRTSQGKFLPVVRRIPQSSWPCRCSRRNCANSPIKTTPKEWVCQSSCVLTLAYCCLIYVYISMSV